MSRRILLVGGGGHCKSVLDSLLRLNEFSDIGIIDKKENYGGNVLGVPVIGCDEDLPRLFSEGYKYAFLTLGSIGNPKTRIRIYNFLEKCGFEIPNIIDSTAVVSHNAYMGKGIFVGKKAVINAEATIHDGSIINTGAIIEHECLINKFVHIAPGAVLSGQVEVGAYSHIGANSVVKQQIKIGANSVIGMGSVVTRDVEDNMVAYGNPCKGVRRQ